MKKAKALRTVTAALTLALLLQAGAAAETTAPQTSEAVETAQSETSAAPATSPALQTSEVPAAPQTSPSPAAQTTVTVHFDLDGGTGTAPADISVQKGAQPACSRLASTGFGLRWCRASITHMRAAFNWMRASSGRLVTGGGVKLRMVMSGRTGISCE